MPTGIVVACQNQRSQHANRDHAWKQLRAKLYELEMSKRNEAAQALEDSSRILAGVARFALTYLMTHGLKICVLALKIQIPEQYLMAIWTSL